MIFLQAQEMPLLNMLFPLLIVVVFYLFFFAPQRKKQKQQASFTESLEKGDEVVTASGIIGKINKINDGIVTLQVDQKTFIRVTKNSISREMTDSLNN